MLVQLNRTPFSKAQTRKEQAKRLMTMALESEKQGISPWTKDSVDVDGTRINNAGFDEDGVGNMTYSRPGNRIED
jgi:hypothetical protein